MLDFYVYILRCNDGSYYVGHTDNIELRLSEHQQGKGCEYTSNRLPVNLVYVAPFGSRDEAFTAERQIKNWSRKKKEALIEENWSLLQKLSKKNF